MDGFGGLRYGNAPDAGGPPVNVSIMLVPDENCILHSRGDEKLHARGRCQGSLCPVFRNCVAMEDRAILLKQKKLVT